MAPRLVIMSGKATMHAPITAIAMPVHCRPVGGSRSQTADSNATRAGCMFTSTTDAETVVRLMDAFHDHKWSASMTPANPTTPVARAP